MFQKKLSTVSEILSQVNLEISTCRKNPIFIKVRENCPVDGLPKGAQEACCATRKTRSSCPEASWTGVADRPLDRWAAERDLPGSSGQTRTHSLRSACSKIICSWTKETERRRALRKRLYAPFVVPADAIQMSDETRTRLATRYLDDARQMGAHLGKDLVQLWRLG